MRAVVFDLDGTLIDSRGDIAASANHALAAHGFEQLSATEIITYVGDGATLLLARAARLEPSDPRVPPLLEAFLAYYTAHPADHTRLCTGAEKTLAALSALPLAICTNKPRVTTVAVLAALGLDSLFEAIVAGGDVGEHKPSPEPVLHVAKLLKLPPSELVMVGDGAQDVESGRAAGARTVGVRGGIQSESKLLLAKPDRLIATLEELPAVLADFRAAGQRASM